jgi:hypothetical protein
MAEMEMTVGVEPALEEAEVGGAHNLLLWLNNSKALLQYAHTNCIPCLQLNCRLTSSFTEYCTP